MSESITLIPPPAEVHARLGEHLRQARLLRRLLKLSLDAQGFEGQLPGNPRPNRRKAEAVPV